MIVNVFKDKIFPLNPQMHFEYEDDRDEDEDNVEDEDEDRFYTPREVTPRNEISDFGITEMFEDEEETPRDMPDLESEESAAQRRNQRGQGLKTLTP